MDGSAVGGYGFEVLVVEAFVVGSNVGVNDGDDEVGAKVELFEEARVANGFEAEELRGVSGVEVAESVGEDGGFGVWVNLDYEGFGLGSGCG